MKVSEVMTREVQTVQPDQPVQEAASFMLSADAGSIPVTDGERLIGMITDRDIAVRGVAKGRGPDTPVRDLMSDDVISVRLDDDCRDVASKMSEAQVRRLPVIDEQSLLLAQQYDGLVDYLLLDTYQSGETQVGATGAPHDWDLSRRIVRLVHTPVILAGGLGPQNVADAIQRVRPFGIDVSSGVEDAPGIKNHARLAALFKAIHAIGINDIAARS